MSEIDKIKQSIQKNLGIRCCVLSKQGRKKVFFENCVLHAAYPEIFVLKHYDEKHKKEKSLSFSYIDLLTKTVFLSKSKDNIAWMHKQIKFF